MDRKNTSSNSEDKVKSFKLVRSGMTEMVLVFADYLKRIDLPHYQTENEFIQWLYSSAGWYDKSISGSFFDIDVQAVKGSEVYCEFLYQYKRSLKGCTNLVPLIHAYPFSRFDLFPGFVESLGSGPEFDWENPASLLSLLRGRVLVVNSFTPLFEQQFPKLDYDFELLTYQTPYTFFNNGPDANSLETLDKVQESLPDCDIALISWGPYGAILADRLWKQGKSVIVTGSTLVRLFQVEPGTTRPGWVPIPESMFPEGYEKIEHGRYWKGPLLN